jgi:hypothetical protein
MTDFVAFNSGCQPLFDHQTCAAMADADGDGMSDLSTLRFAGEGNRTYVIESQTNAWNGSWGEGATVEVSEDTYGQAEIVGRYRIDFQLRAQPLDVGTNQCRASPALLAGLNGEPPHALLPNGERLYIAAGDNGLYQNAPRDWLLVAVGPANGQPRLEVVSEGALAPDYDEFAMATQGDTTGARRELAFLSADRVPKPLPATQP